MWEQITQLSGVTFFDGCHAYICHNTLKARKKRLSWLCLVIVLGLDSILVGRWLLPLLCQRLLLLRMVCL
jgi:hypothetical protein